MYQRELSDSRVIKVAALTGSHPTSVVHPVDHPSADYCLMFP